jgi:hypothetical protein
MRLIKTHSGIELPFNFRSFDSMSGGNSIMK